MRFGLASYEFRNNDISFNLSQIEKAIKEAKEKDVQLLCFGETFLQGFESLKWKYEDDKQVAVSLDSDEIYYIKELSRKYEIDLFVGYVELEPADEKLYSSYVLIESGRVKYNYRRISKNWKEYEKTDEHYCEGDTVEDIAYRGIKLSTGLCGDLWIFPERFKTDSILIWPVFVDFSLEEWKTEMLDYAQQANLISKNVLMVNSICKDEICVSHGGAFYLKNGEIMDKTKFDNEQVLVVEI